MVRYSIVCPHCHEHFEQPPLCLFGYGIDQHLERLSEFLMDYVYSPLGARKLKKLRMLWDKASPEYQELLCRR